MMQNWAIALLGAMLAAGTANALDFTRLERFGSSGYGVACGDFNNDGLFDAAVVCSSGVGRLYLGAGDGTFTEYTPFDTVPRGMRAATCADYDNDGNLDFFTADSPFVYRNAGGGIFTELSLVSHRAPDQGPGISLADYNNDGWVDLLAPGDSGETTVFRNDSGTFVQSGVFLPPARGGSWGDLDNDGLPDLVLNNGGTLTYENVGNDTFVAHGTGFPGGMPHCVAIGDYNCDGLLDIVSNEFLVVLGTNERDFDFTLSRPFGVGTRTVQNCTWGDFDNDGILDLALNEESILYLFYGDGKGNFARVEAAYCGDSKGFAACDVDDDGDLDLAVMNTTGPDYLLRNETNRPDFIKIRLVGRGGNGFTNRTAIGARVALYDQRGTLHGLREVNGGIGYFTSMDAPEIHFGAAAGDTFTLVVSWPASGIVDTLRNVVPPARLRILENRDPTRFSLVSPGPGAKVGRRPTLVWNAATDPDGDVLTYTLCYGKDPTFGTCTEVAGLADTTWTPAAPLDSTTYYWRARAADPAHPMLSFRNCFTDSAAVDTVPCEACSREEWSFSTTAAGISEESGGRSEEIAAPSLTIERNPTRGAVTVRCTLPAGQSGALSILDAAGRVTVSHILSAHTSRLTVNVPPGVYFLRLSCPGTRETCKLVVVD